MLFEYFWKTFETLWNVLILLLESLWNMFGMRFRIWIKMRLDKNAFGLVLDCRLNAFGQLLECLDIFWNTLDNFWNVWLAF